MESPRVLRTRARPKDPSPPCAPLVTWAPRPWLRALARRATDLAHARVTAEAAGRRRRRLRAGTAKEARPPTEAPKGTQRRCLRRRAPAAPPRPSVVPTPPPAARPRRIPPSRGTRTSAPASPMAPRPIPAANPQLVSTALSGRPRLSLIALPWVPRPNLKTSRSP